MGVVKFVSIKKKDLEQLIKNSEDDSDAIYFTEDTKEIITTKGQDEYEEQNKSDDQ